MKTNRFLFLAASLSLVMAFTYSCSLDDSNGDGQQQLQPSDGLLLNKLLADNGISGVCTAADNTATHYCSNGTMKAYVFVTYAGQTYKTVVIGTQTWMAENSNYNVIGSRCYNNLTSNCNKYGRLYTWAMAMSACPSGWRLASNADWDQLLRYVDGTSGTSSPYRSPTAARFLKAISGWNYCSLYGSPYFCEDTYGFAALPGGQSAYSLSSFFDAGEMGWWWTSNSFSDASGNANAGAHYILMGQSDDIVYRGPAQSTYMHSARCIKN
jgi:uncharacterized protein (TIGR02145 family)